MTSRSGAAILVTLLVAGCVSSPEGDSSVEPSSGASPSAGALCTVPPPDFESVYESLQENDPLDCYGDAELTFDAFWTGGPGGAIDCPGIDPSWLSCETSINVMPPEDQAAITLAATTGDIIGLWVAIHPDADLGEDPSWQGNATLTAHFDDPSAADCTYRDLVGDLTNEEAVDSCRRTLVVTVLEPL
jgi:hypothetical protein